MKKFKNKYRKSEVINAYLFISPFFLLFLIFQLYPMVWSFILSFYKWNGLSAMEFVGIENYKTVLNDSLFWGTLKNTMIYLIANLVVIIPLAIVLAYAFCSRSLPFKKFFKTVSVLPYITSTVAAGIIFSMLFDTRIGIINSFLSNFGINAIPWLTDMSISKIPVIFLSIWRNTPWYMLVIMAAMLGVDESLYESARIDGANGLQRMFKITLPSISPMLFFALITLTIESARIFTEPHVLTKGGPSSSSMSTVQYMYETGFTIFKMGYSSTIGYMLTFILIIVSIFYFRSLRHQSEI